MIILLAYDKMNKPRAVEIEDGNREKIQQEFENMGWTNLIFCDK